MRTFKKPNLSNNWKCPICGTNEEKEVVLIAVAETEEGHNVQANQYHLDCIKLTEYDYGSTYGVVLAMKFWRKDK